MTEMLLLMAEDPASQPAAPGWGAIFHNPLVPLILMLGAFWWLMIAGRRKEQRRYQEMLSSLKRNDRVLTISGIIGTVVEVRDDTVVLKVDETNNVKMQFARSAVKDILRESAPAAAR
ncbi:MAG: preprotein translocase subunit YajC [Phycisphaerales bacterium]|nr:preprotein translocase subunit YajC [Phycisphaerales bacterium]